MAGSVAFAFFRFCPVSGGDFEEVYSPETESQETQDQFTDEVLIVGSANLAGLRGGELGAHEFLGWNWPFLSSDEETYTQLESVLEENHLDILITQEDTTGSIWGDYFNCFEHLASFYGHGYIAGFTYDLGLGLIEGSDFSQAHYSSIPAVTGDYYYPADEMDLGIWSNLQEHFVGLKGISTTSYMWAGRQIFVDNFHLPSGDFLDERQEIFELYLVNVFDVETTRIFGGDMNEDVRSEFFQMALEMMAEYGLENFDIWPELGLIDGSFNEEYNTFEDTTIDILIGYSPDNLLEMVDYSVVGMPSDHQLIMATFKRKW